MITFVYLYRFQLLRITGGGSQIVTMWFTDPFARATDIGELSSFATPGFFPDFTWEDAAYKTPELDDLIVYELQIQAGSKGTAPSKRRALKHGTAHC